MLENAIACWLPWQERVYEMRNVLVMGGTTFFGKRLVHYLLKDGYRVTVATRGQTKDAFGEQIERIRFDRTNLTSMKQAFEDEEYDIVFDQIGFCADDMADACEVFSGKIGRYVFTSSIIVYYSSPGLGKVETDFDPLEVSYRKGRYPEDTKQFPVAQGAGTVVFWLVWVFFLLAILQILGLEGVLSSVVVLFEKIFAVIPNILGAVIILVVFYLLAGLLTRLVTNLLTSIQFNRVPVKLGLSRKVIEGQWSPSNIVGYFAATLVMVLAVIMATDMLGFTAITNLVSKFTEFFAQAILAVVILAIGIFLVNILAKMLQTSGLSPTLLRAIRAFIMVFIIAIALSTLGIADDVILLGFGLILGSIALASAIAFGIGGREVAGDLLARWTKSEKSTNTHESDE